MPGLTVEIRNSGDAGRAWLLPYLGEDVEVYDPDLPPGDYHGPEAVLRVSALLMSGFDGVEIRDFKLLPGKIVYWRLYADQAEALSDAGLDPSLAVPSRPVD